jgi:hypothetical protein
VAATAAGVDGSSCVVDARGGELWSPFDLRGKISDLLVRCLSPADDALRWILLELGVQLSTSKRKYLVPGIKAKGLLPGSYSKCERGGVQLCHPMATNPRVRYLFG